MKGIRILFAALIILALAPIPNNARAENIEKVICFTAVRSYRDVAGTDTQPAHRLVWAIVDGELTRLKVLPETTLLGLPGYNTWPRPCKAAFSADGYVVKTSSVPGLISGYSIYPPSDGRIMLGADELEYTFAEGARVFIATGEALPVSYEITPEELKRGWDDGWHILLNDFGEIETMYLVPGSSRTQTGAGLGEDCEDDTGIYGEIRKFNTARGPVDGDTGLSTEYLYFTPVTRSGAKYPLVIWLHDMWGGVSTWAGLFDQNSVARFASYAYQSRFESKGAYIMAPVAAEDLDRNMSWNELQLGAFFSALDDFLELNPSIDRNRIYIGGGSTGGGMTWLALRERPDFFAAAFPHSPIGFNAMTDEEFSAFAALPLWLVHCNGDSVSPVTVTTSVMPVLASGAIRTGTDTRFSIWEKGFKEPDGVTSVSDSHKSWIPTMNNMRYSDGTLYSDMNGIPVKSTFIEWLNSQTASANNDRRRASTFEDVDTDQWFYEYVMELYDAGIVDGVGDRLFAPDGETTYGQFLKLIMLASGGEEQAPTGTHWASGYYAKAIADGLVTKEAELDSPIDRITVADITAKALGLESTLEQSPFPDTSDPAVLALYEAEIMTGSDDGMFEPDASVTRAQVCAIIWRVMRF